MNGIIGKLDEKKKIPEHVCRHLLKLEMPSMIVLWNEGYWFLFLKVKEMKNKYIIVFYAGVYIKWEYYTNLLSIANWIGIWFV